MALSKEKKTPFTSHDSRPLMRRAPPSPDAVFPEDSSLFSRMRCVCSQWVCVCGQNACVMFCTVSPVELADLWIVLLTPLSVEASGTLPFNLDLFGLGAIVFVVFLEPVMLQGLVCRDTLLWIVDKDFLQQIEELAVELVVGWDDFLKSV